MTAASTWLRSLAARRPAQRRPTKPGVEREQPREDEPGDQRRRRGARTAPGSGRGPARRSSPPADAAAPTGRSTPRRTRAARGSASGRSRAASRAGSSAGGAPAARRSRDRPRSPAGPRARPARPPPRGRGRSADGVAGERLEHGLAHRRRRSGHRATRPPAPEIARRIRDASLAARRAVHERGEPAERPRAPRPRARPGGGDGLALGATQVHDPQRLRRPPPRPPGGAGRGRSADGARARPTRRPSARAPRPRPRSRRRAGRRRPPWRRSRRRATPGTARCRPRRPSRTPRGRPAGVEDDPASSVASTRPRWPWTRSAAVRRQAIGLVEDDDLAVEARDPAPQEPVVEQRVGVLLRVGDPGDGVDARQQLLDGRAVGRLDRVDVGQVEDHDALERRVVVEPPLAGTEPVEERRDAWRRRRRRPTRRAAPSSGRRAPASLTVRPASALSRRRLADAGPADEGEHVRVGHEAEPLAGLGLDGLGRRRCRGRGPAAAPIASSSAARQRSMPLDVASHGARAAAPARRGSTSSSSRVRGLEVGRRRVPRARRPHRRGSGARRGARPAAAPRRRRPRRAGAWRGRAASSPSGTSRRYRSSSSSNVSVERHAQPRPRAVDHLDQRRLAEQRLEQLLVEERGRGGDARPRRRSARRCARTSRASRRSRPR